MRESQVIRQHESLYARTLVQFRSALQIYNPGNIPISDRSNVAVALGGENRKDFTVHQADLTSCPGHGLPPLDGTMVDWLLFAMVLTEDFVLYVQGGQETGATITGELSVTVSAYSC